MQLFKHRTILCIISPILCLLSQTNIDCYMLLYLLVGKSYTYISFFYMRIPIYVWFTSASYYWWHLRNMYWDWKKEIPTCSDMLLPIKYRIQSYNSRHPIMNMGTYKYVGTIHISVQLHIQPKRYIFMFSVIIFSGKTINWPWWLFCCTLTFQILHFESLTFWNVNFFYWFSQF